MVTSIKTPTTIDEQVLQLQERGMVIGDCADLKTWLRTVGYYKLSGYWWIYEDQYPKSSPRTHKFKDDTSWNRVKHTYIFDQKFRRLISTGIEKIEIAVKASWAQHLATHYGTSHPHEDPSIFRKDVCERSKIKGQPTAFDLLVSAYKKSKEPFAVHYKEKYPTINTPPIWVSSLLITLGELLNWISGIKSRSDKKAIFSNFPFDYKPMQSVLGNLRWVRNVCAHNGRLWNKRTPFVFTPIKSMNSVLIRSDSDKNELDSKIYNTIMAMAEILKAIDPDYPFLYFIKELIIHSKYINPALMGFPNTWEQLPYWKEPTPLPRHIAKKKERRKKRRAKKVLIQDN